MENVKVLLATSPHAHTGPPPRNGFALLGADCPKSYVDSAALFRVLIADDSVLLSPQFFAKFGGAGFLPWECHRPQRAIRELARRGEFRNGARVLDIGCGIGDNALFLAKFCKCHVVACDKVSRCLEFGKLKAHIRNLPTAVSWVEQDILEPDAPEALGAPFDVVLDSCMLACFTDEQRERYVANLRRLVRPGGRLHIIALAAEKELREGPRKLSQPELRNLFGGVEFGLTQLEETVYEQHPSAYQYASYVATYTRARQSSSGVGGSGMGSSGLGGGRHSSSGARPAHA